MSVLSGRGTIGDMGKSFGGIGSTAGGGGGGGGGSGFSPFGFSRRQSSRRRRPTEPDFMAKVRKRRETSADITVIRKPVVVQQGVGVGVGTMIGLSGSAAPDGTNLSR